MTEKEMTAAAKTPQDAKLLSTPPVEKKKDPAAEKLETERSVYKASSTSAHIDAFFKDIDARAQAHPISTGLPTLDKLLDGQLREGLIVLGAVSSQGKTTLALQIADNVAAGGDDVLYFSLEQGELELMAKSISRVTYELARGQNDESLASTSHFIATKADWKAASPAKKQLILTAADTYRHRIDGHLYISESVGDVSSVTVRKAIEYHEQMTGRLPGLVVIYYLQIMRAADPRATDKQNCDAGMHELKQLSRDFHLPILLISSFNRDSYWTPVDMNCFKESGSIEYGCDVLLALQYDGMDYLLGESEKDKNRPNRIRELKRTNEESSKNSVPVPMQIKVLKNRNGPKNSAILNYLHCYNVFLDPLGASTGAPEAVSSVSPQMNVWGEIEKAREAKKKKPKPPLAKSEPDTAAAVADCDELPF